MWDGSVGWGEGPRWGHLRGSPASGTGPLLQHPPLHTSIAGRGAPRAPVRALGTQEQRHLMSQCCDGSQSSTSDTPKGTGKGTTSTRGQTLC